MTFDDVFKQLAAIDKAAVSLLTAACFYPDEGLRGSVRPLADPAQDSFLRHRTGNLLQSLALLHKEFRYLTSPVSGEYPMDFLTETGTCMSFPAERPSRQSSMTDMAGHAG